jgi:hypothetical protein
MQMTHGAGCFIRASKPPAKKIRYKLAINLLSCPGNFQQKCRLGREDSAEPGRETLNHHLTSPKYRTEKRYLQPLR